MRILDLRGVSGKETTTLHSYLKTPTVVLKEHRDGAPITVSRHPSHGPVIKVCRRHRRIMKEPELVVVAGMQMREEILVVHANTDRNSPKQHLGDRVHLPVEAGHIPAEAR